MNKIAFVFPGQGSQSVGMLDALSAYPLVTECVQQAGQILNSDLLKTINEGPKELLNQTQWTQPALLAVSVGVFKTLQAHSELQINLMAGHSLGEYSALVCAGSISFEEAVKLVYKRGLYMQDAVPVGTGSMAAVLGLDAVVVEEVCQQVQQSSDSTVSPANYNSPGQIVIAGTVAAVEAAGLLCKDAGAKKVMPLAVSVPSHCELMRPAADRLIEDLKAINFQPPKYPILHNVDVQSHSNADEIQSLLEQQLYAPVRWSQIMEAMQQAGVNKVMECGPGKVLSGLFKRFDRNMQTLPLFNNKGIESFKNEL